jgi:hypothetical protein
MITDPADRRGQFPIFVACFFLCVAITAQAQTLTSTDVAAGLALASKKPADYIVTDGATWFEVTVVGKLGRIAMAAELSKRNYKPFTAADVPADLLRDEVYVEVVPTKPVISTIGPPTINVAPPFSAIILKAADGSILQPLTLERTPHSFSNSVGATFNAEGAKLTFPPLPPGDFSIVVVTPGREYVAEFKGKARQKIQ